MMMMVVMIMNAIITTISVHQHHDGDGLDDPRPLFETLGNLVPSSLPITGVLHDAVTMV